MTDWYNFIIQHNPIPKGFEKGKGGAYETPLRDKSHGRVYRIVYSGAKSSPTHDLSNASTAQLVETLKSDNMLWRMHAQRLLVEKGDKSALPALLALAADPSMDEIGLNPAVIHALWTIHGLGGFDGEGAAGTTAAAVNALKHPSAGVRHAAIDVLPRTEQSVEAILGGKLLADRDAQVRKAALLALSEMPPSDAAGKAIYGSLSRKENAGDKWIMDAAAIAGAHNDAGYLKAVFEAHPAVASAAAAAGAATPSNGSASEPATASSSAAAVPAAAKAVNLIPNPSFEQVVQANGAARSWKPRQYSGEAKLGLADIGHTGGHSLLIESAEGSDTSWFVNVPVSAGAAYRLSAWIKTENLTTEGEAVGALLNVHGTEFKTRGVKGTRDWQKVELTFKAPGPMVSINCLYGGWGHAKGKAWFDDVELVAIDGPVVMQVDTAAGGDPVDRVTAIVVNQYAQRGPADSVVATISAAGKADPALGGLVLNSLAAGWPRGNAPKLSDADVTELRRMMASLPPDARNRLLALAERWDRRDLFTEQNVAAAKELRAAVANATLDAAQRGSSARKLLGIDDSKSAVDAVVTEISPTTPPDAQLALLEALADSRSPEVGAAVVAQWPKLTPSAQKAATNLLIRRETWASSLLDGVKLGAISHKDVLPQQWQSLTSFPDEKIAARAKELQTGGGREIVSDRKALVDKAMPILQRQGDPEKGRLVFEKNCLVCHTLEGKGGKVGPELTGIGARPRADNLIQILDPNRSVEGTYKQWTAKTDDDVISGRLFSESKTSIEIMDSAGVLHPLQRDQIKSLKSSDKGVMPEGFEQLPPDDLLNVVEYLATSKVKH